MIKTWIKGKVTSCKITKRENAAPGFPKVFWGVMMDIDQIGTNKLPEGMSSVFFFDLPDEVPVGASIEFIYEVGEGE